MKPSTDSIAKAAIDAAFEMLRQNGLEEDSARLIDDLKRELDLRQVTTTATLITPSGDAGEVALEAKQMLEKQLHRTIDFRQRADASLLGGWILEYGDTRIDRSVRGALTKARQHLESSAN